MSVLNFSCNKKIIKKVTETIHELRKHHGEKFCFW